MEENASKIGNEIYISSNGCAREISQVLAWAIFLVSVVGQGRGWGSRERRSPVRHSKEASNNK